ncbi:PEP-CTERM sorting domain-containing protein [Pontiella agarivorans]|uniref:PEP-CTERM sorting domain-containing protein n=1 Tax=Pontiella agarivorans TaxID=3038953 RepID=A0ABU5MW92_9BACT|nr:PEP-CTERM sorting domain-containing protein [Pontiella agarivorans]MDZ8118440.1 PEP-CTERM sorting domain-containing protein [Pontiella agarivorans]
MSGRMYFTCGAVALTLCVCADVSVITAVGPVEGWWAGGSNSSNKTMNVLSTLTDQSGSYSGFTGIDHVVSANDSVVYGSIATENPVTGVEALTDNRLDTGIMGAAANVEYGLGESVSSNHVLALIWNATSTTDGTTSRWYDQPGSIEAFSNTGIQVGGPVNLTDVGGSHFGTANLTGASELNKRGLFGVTVDMADFGGTTADIAYVRMTGTPDMDDVDMMYVGTAAVPEPATLGLVALFGGAVLCIRRIFMV